MFGNSKTVGFRSPARQNGTPRRCGTIVANLKPFTDGWVRGLAVFMAMVAAGASLPRAIWAAEGELTLKVVDETTGEPTVARVELIRPELTVLRGGTTKRSSRKRTIAPLPARGTVPTGFGFVLDDSVRLRLNEGP